MKDLMLSHYSACRPVRDGKGRHSGGVGVFVSRRVKQRVEFVKAAADAKYLWLSSLVGGSLLPDDLIMTLFTAAMTCSTPRSTYNHWLLL